MTILPCPTFPLAMHSTFGQNCVEAFICSSVVFCIDIVYRCLPLFQVAPASPPPVNAALPERRIINDKTYFDLEVIGGASIFLVQSEMGAGGPGGATLV